MSPRTEEEILKGFEPNNRPYERVLDKVNDVSKSVLEEALKYGTEKSGETVKSYQNFAKIFGVTNDTLNWRMEKIQNAVHDYVSEVEKVAKLAEATCCSQRFIDKLDRVMEEYLFNRGAGEAITLDGQSSVAYEERLIDAALTKIRDIYDENGVERDLKSFAGKIPSRDLYYKTDNNNDWSTSKKEGYNLGSTKQLTKNDEDVLFRNLTIEIESFKKAKVDRAKDLIDQINTARDSLITSLSDLPTEEEIRNGTTQRPSPRTSGFTMLSADAQKKVDLTSLSGGVVGTIPESVAGKEPGDLTKTSPKKTDEEDTTKESTTDTKDSEKKDQSKDTSSRGSGSGSSSGGGSRAGAPSGGGGGGSRKSKKDKDKDKKEGKTDSKSADDILSQLMSSAKTSANEVANAAAPFVNPMLNAMGLPGIGQPMPGMPGSPMGMPSAPMGIPGIGAPGSPTGMPSGMPGTHTPGMPGSPLGGTPGIGGQPGTPNGLNNPLGQPNNAGTPRAMDPNLAAQGAQLRAESNAAMRDNDKLVKDTAKVLNDTADKIEKESEKKNEVPKDDNKGAPKPEGDAGTKPPEGDKPEGETPPPPPGETPPEGGEPEPPAGEAPPAPEEDKPSEGEETPPTGNEEPTPAADNPEDNPAPEGAEPPPDPSIHAEATGTITRDGVTFQVEDVRMSAVVDGINPLDGSPATPLREAAINAGYNIPESGPIGTPVSPSEAKPGDIIIAAGAEGVITGEGSVITANGKMALSDVASFDEPDDGIYRLS